MKPLLDFNPSGAVATPKDAATIVVARDTDEGPMVFCVERNKKSRFLGGAIVFPGGKLEEADRDPSWQALATEPRPARDGMVGGSATLRALTVAALRETLEEAALLIATGDVDAAKVPILRAAIIADPRMLPLYLGTYGLRLDAESLHPFARWITPEAETRRYDTRFFLARAPDGQAGAHDMQETMASFWARPSALLARFDAGEVQVAPPTHRTLQVFASASSVTEMFAIAERASLLPIVPKLFQLTEGDVSSLALALPGDPEHEEKEIRVAGPTRYVLRGEHWRAESP